MIDEQRTDESPTDALLRDIREDYTYFCDYWRQNYEEAKIDLRYVSGDPWEPDDRKAREDNGRPVVSPDELGQYLNQAINNLRQNKRAIKVNPAGNGAEDKDAERRGALIRGIEYKSNAQSAYENAFSCALNCGFGFFRVTTKRVNKKGEVEPRIKIIENPLSVLMDPGAKEADFSDMKRCFVIDVMRQRDFARNYPKAQKRSFTAGDFSTVQAGNWFDGQNVVVAEYWRIDGYDEDGEGGRVTQYITNGLEILEKNEWPGSRIPIIATTGQKVYVPSGGEMRRMFYSAIRKARGPQMMLAYIASQEAEEYGMAPRAPLMGYVGQFETDKEAWDTLNKVPRSYVQVDPVTDQSNGAILPMPQRNPFTPNASAYEIGFERWRRSVQSAMGITPLPTAAQRQNEKSGVALERIQTQQSIGFYHFTDNFDRSLENAGRQLDELITKVMDTPRQVAVRNPDESHALMHVVPGGQPMPQPTADGQEPEVLDPQKGDFDVTISTGPSYQSQREEASQFVDLITQNLAQLPPPGSPQAKILALGVKLKAIGPIGDEIADTLDPPDQGQLPPQAQAVIAQAQQHVQMMQGEMQKLLMEKQGKVIEHQGKMQQIQLQSQVDMALEDKKLQTQITVAEISTKAQITQEREAFVREMMAQFHDQAHDIAAQAAQQAHERAMAQMQAQQQSALADQQAQNQSAQSAQDAAQSQAAQQDQGE